MDSSVKPYSLEQIVINTRPVERAEPLTRCLEAAGLTVIDLPMLALQEHTITETDNKVMRAWLAGEYQALIMVSPTAASLGLAMWRKLTSQDEVKSINSDGSGLNIATDDTLSTAPSHLIAVGTATAKVLQQANLAATSFEVLQPTIANNEGMLAMPEIEQLQAGDKLLVWRGLGGRRLLVDTLQARGVHIDSIAWYERMMPENAVIDYQHWVQQYNSQSTSLSSQSKPIVIISSGSVFEHWSHVVSHDMQSDLMLNSNKNISNQAKHFNVADFTYIVLGVRLADMLAEQQLDYLQVEDLAPTTILAAIESLANRIEQ